MVNLSDLVDKLSIQINSFQEGFEILSHSGDLNDLGKQFCHILRGNLLTVDVSLFHQNTSSKDWTPLYVNKESRKEDTGRFESTGSISIKYIDEKELKVIAILPMVDKTEFGLLIGNKLDKSEFTDFEKITLQIFLQLLDNSYQAFINRKKEKELIFSLNNSILQLNSLIDTGIEISKEQSASALISLALEGAASLTNASKAFIRVSKEDEVIEEHFFPFEFDSETIPETNLISAEFKLLDNKYEFILCEKESRQGIIPFEQTDTMLLESISRQVNVALENNYLHQQALEKERMQKEMEVAASIQQMIIPDSLPEIEGYDIFGINIPSREVGGDYYDFIKLENGKYAFLIADVSGKGISAALLVSSLNASLQPYLESDFSLTDLAFKLNKIIFNASTPDKYITAFIAIFDPESGELESVNAGHNPIFLRRNSGELVKLEKGGVALGMLDFGLPFESEKTSLENGDSLLLYTDGVTEAMNEKEEEFSDEKLKKMFTDENKLTAKEFINKLVDDVKTHTGSTPQSDDITAMCIVKN